MADGQRDTTSIEAFDMSGFVESSDHIDDTTRALVSLSLALSLSESLSFLCHWLCL